MGESNQWDKKDQMAQYIGHRRKYATRFKMAEKDAMSFMLYAPKWRTIPHWSLDVRISNDFLQFIRQVGDELLKGPFPKGRPR